LSWAAWEGARTGPIEVVKETAATVKTVRDAAESGGRGELIDAVAQENKLAEVLVPPALGG
jgi:hypothetical protein